MALTITEALAEIKTINKRIEKKREFIQGFLFRQEGLKDPLEKDGGSIEAIRRERQSVTDLETRILDIRREIQRANDATQITVGDKTLSMAEWLTWRRDVAPGQQAFLAGIRRTLYQLREQAKRGGANVLSAQASVTSGDAKPTDYIVNVDEATLGREIENLENILGNLDGQLSLKNATVMLELEAAP